jgi:hypothetical protein
MDPGLRSANVKAAVVFRSICCISQSVRVVTIRVGHLRIADTRRFFSDGDESTCDLRCVFTAQNSNKDHKSLITTSCVHTNLALPEECHGDGDHGVHTMPGPHAGLVRLASVIMTG